MRQLVVLSGKGGTGKTSITASFATLSNDALVVADCDVDAPDLHFLLAPEIQEEHPFVASGLPEIDGRKCIACGRCIQFCRFDAIYFDYQIDDIACEGCGLCAHVCPEAAITMRPKVSGHWYESMTAYGPMVHARLDFGEGNSGKLVTQVKEQGRKIAEASNRHLLLIDGPAGTGCPVIAALSGATEALLVAEPSISGLHDLKKIVAVCRHFDVPVGICINRHDIDSTYTECIQSMADMESIPVVGHVPYDENVTWAQLEGQTIVNYDEGPAATAIRTLWAALSNGELEAT